MKSLEDLKALREKLQSDIRVRENNLGDIKTLDVHFRIGDTYLTASETTLYAQTYFNNYSDICDNNDVLNVHQVLDYIQKFITSYEITKDESNIHLIQKKNRFSSTKSARKTVN